MSVSLDGQNIMKLIIDGTNITEVNIDGTKVAGKPVITTQPTGGTYEEGASVSLTVAANGFGSSLSYQWFKGDTAIDGATSATYTFTTNTEGTASYFCRVIGFGGSTDSSKVNVITETSYTCSITMGRNTSYQEIYGFNGGSCDTCGSMAGSIVLGGATYDADHFMKFQSGDSSYSGSQTGALTFKVWDEFDTYNDVPASGTVIFKTPLSSGVTSVHGTLYKDSSNNINFSSDDNPGYFSAADYGLTYDFKWEDD